LFLPYSRDDRSHSVSGTGLGLMISKRAALRVGGEIGYQPREGGGSCFSLRFPMGAKFARTQSGLQSVEFVSEPKREERRGSRRRAEEEEEAAAEEEEVVVCEDNLINQKVMIAMLKRENVVPLAVLPDGGSAMHFLLGRLKVRGGKRLLLLLDDSMPVLSGRTIARVCREIEKEYSVKSRIWLVTASNVEQCEDVDGVLRKPVSMKALTDVLRGSK
jgi:CheY-like chemotaxis protein